MISNEKAPSSLSDVAIHVKYKLSGLWATTMLLFIYGDLFGFFKRQTLTEIVSGNGGFISTQVGLFAAALSVAIPSVMVVLPLFLKPNVSRWLNIIFGVAYTIIILVTMPGAWAYYIFLSSNECVLTLQIVWFAWFWPKERASQRAAEGSPRVTPR